MVYSAMICNQIAIYGRLYGIFCYDM